MDRPRTPVGWVVRLVLIVLCVAVVTILLRAAFGLVGGFIDPASGEEFGNAGYLILAVLALVFAAPFVSLALAIGLPMVSKDPRFRGADR